MSNSRITTEDLLAYAARELGPAEAARIEAHLEADSAAKTMVSCFAAVRKCVAEDDSIEASEEISARAKAIFGGNPVESGPSWLDRLGATIAQVIFDSRLHPAGVRYAGAGGCVQLTYETDNLDVDLQAERTEAVGDPGAGPRWMLIGQINPAEDGPGSPVALVTSGTSFLVAQTKADERAIFTLDAPAGRYDLFLGLPDGVIILPGLDLG